MNQLKQVQVPAGFTLAEALDVALMDAAFDWPRDCIVASVGDVRVPREHWHRVRPKPGTVVVFRPVAQNDDFLRSALGFAVAIAALFIAPVLAPIIGTIGATLVTAAITIGGSLLINALIPIRKPQLKDTTEKDRTGRSLPMVGGAQNEVAPWQAVPVVLGRHRISPRFAAKPYTFISGHKQFMNVLFCVGYGRLQLTDLKLGETPLANFEEVQYEIKEGIDLNETTTLFPSFVDELGIANLTLKSTDGFVSRTTTTDDAEQLSIDLIATNGIYSYNTSNGNFESRDVVVNIRYRRVGDVSFTNRPDITFTRSRDTYRRGDLWSVPKGQYEVQVRKLTSDYAGTGQVAEAIQWITLRGIVSAQPVDFPKPLCLVAIRIRATDQLNGIVDNFNCVAESYLPLAYNGSAWVANQLSRNPADLFRHVLQGPACGSPRTDAQLDLPSIQAWWADCNANDFTYNAVQFEARPVREVLADVAAAGRATVALRNGKWGVTFPRQTDVVAWHFSPRVMTSFKTERHYRKPPHGLRCRFVDQDNGWRETERLVFDDGYSEANATLYESVEFPGVTESSKVWVHGRYQLAQARLRPEKHTMGVDVEGLRLERGDKVTVANDVLLISQGYGRVVSVNATTKVVTVDSRVIMEVGKDYRGRFRRSVDGTNLSRHVINTANETRQLVLDPDEATQELPQVGDMFVFGELQAGGVVRQYRVMEVHPGEDLSAQVVLVDDAPEIDDADTATIPPYDPGIQQPPDPYQLAPKNITVSERLLGSGITVKSEVQLTVQIPRVGTIRAFEFQAKDIDAGGDWTPFAVVPAPYLTATKENLEPGSWQFRVRSLFADDHNTRSTDYSAWVTSIATVLQGVFVPPPDVTGASVVVTGDDMRLSWDAVGAPNFKEYAIRYNQAVDGSATWNGSLELRTSVTNYIDLPTKRGTYIIKARTWQGVDSVNGSAVILDAASAGVPNVVATVQEDPTFPGAKTNVVAAGGILSLAQSGGRYVSEGFYAFATNVVLGAIYPVRLEVQILATGITIGDTIDKWAKLSDVKAMDSANPAAWSVKPVYAFNNFPAPNTANWSPYIPFTITDSSGYRFRFGCYLYSTDGQTSPAISQLRAVVDMPDRHIGFNGLSTGTAAGGFTVNFDPPFHTLFDVQITWHDIDSQNNGEFQILEKTVDHVKLRVLNQAGVAISKVFDIHAYGYGMIIT